MKHKSHHWFSEPRLVRSIAYYLSPIIYLLPQISSKVSDSF